MLRNTPCRWSTLRRNDFRRTLPHWSTLRRSGSTLSPGISLRRSGLRPTLRRRSTLRRSSLRPTLCRRSALRRSGADPTLRRRSVLCRSGSTLSTGCHLRRIRLCAAVPRRSTLRPTLCRRSALRRSGFCPALRGRRALRRSGSVLRRRSALHRSGFRRFLRRRPAEPGTALLLRSLLIPPADLLGFRRSTCGRPRPGLSRRRPLDSRLRSSCRGATLRYRPFGITLPPGLDRRAGNGGLRRCRACRACRTRGACGACGACGARRTRGAARLRRCSRGTCLRCRTLRVAGLALRRSGLGCSAFRAAGRRGCGVGAGVPSGAGCTCRAAGLCRCVIGACRAARCACLGTGLRARGCCTGDLAGAGRIRLCCSAFRGVRHCRSAVGTRALSGSRRTCRAARLCWYGVRDWPGPVGGRARLSCAFHRDRFGLGSFRCTRCSRWVTRLSRRGGRVRCCCGGPVLPCDHLGFGGAAVRCAALLSSCGFRRTRHGGVCGAWAALRTLAG